MVILLVLKRYFFVLLSEFSGVKYNIYYNFLKGITIEVTYTKKENSHTFLSV